jgi:membrane-anchored protein YejM (alkaline phosphatase superfamily)
LSFFDLHHNLNHIPDISSQKSNLLRDHTYKKNILNSPFLSYDEKLENWYKNEASRLDVYLQLLYSYILENYDMKDVIISLVSDHGQAYVGTQKDLLSEQKLTTPMMYVGGGVNSCDSDEIVQNIDYLPTLLMEVFRLYVVAVQPGSFLFQNPFILTGDMKFLYMIRSICSI